MNEQDNIIRVILDTNFLLIPGQFKVDIFDEIKKLMNCPYKMYIFKATFNELEKIASKKSKDSPNAKIALKLIKQQNLKTLENSQNSSNSSTNHKLERANEYYVDAILLENVTNLDIVCTQDADLKRVLKQRFKKLKIITLKNKKYLHFDV